MVSEPQERERLKDADRRAADIECMRCCAGPEDHAGDVDYSGCGACREPDHDACPPGCQTTTPPHVEFFESRFIQDALQRYVEGSPEVREAAYVDLLRLLNEARAGRGD